MRIVVALLACLALAACGEDDEPAVTPAALADLRVAVDYDGKDPKSPLTATIRCDAPEDSPVCRKVAQLKPEALEPTPRGVACTQQYGGPETATVTGTLRGEPVDERFSRENGCEISRWQDAAAILGAAR